MEVKKTPAPVTGKPKRRGAPAGWVEPFAFDELGRFEARYYTHRSDEYTWEGGEPERETVVERALPIPAEFWPVSRPEARRAPGPPRSHSASIRPLRSPLAPPTSVASETKSSPPTPGGPTKAATRSARDVKCS